TRLRPAWSGCPSIFGMNFRAVGCGIRHRLSAELFHNSGRLCPPRSAVRLQLGLAKSGTRRNQQTKAKVWLARLRIISTNQREAARNGAAQQMSEQPPKRAKILTRLRINEVSLVDRGAGQDCRVVISKRDDANDDNRPVEMPEHERRYWAALGATALRPPENRYTR